MLEFDQAVASCRFDDCTIIVPREKAFKMAEERIYDTLGGSLPFDDKAGGTVGGPVGTSSSTDLFRLSISAQVAENVPCFVTGTRIHTMRGDVAVEELQAGDEAITASGEIRPIVWVGHRVIDCTVRADPSEMWPVRVRAGAFGADLPERDLLLSPGHPVLVGSGEKEVLVPIMCLINGTTVDRGPVDSITYWHVELDQHDILCAEGLPVESYLDWGDRDFFSEGVDHALANPDFVVPGLVGRCRPVVVDGPVVEAERRRLGMVFATELFGACGWPDEDFAALP